MAHTPFSDTARYMATEGWGRNFDSQDEAAKHLSTSLDLSGACLLGLTQRIELILSALTDDEIRRRFKPLRRHADEAMNAFVQPREQRHGPCPVAVWRDLREQCRIKLGSYVLDGFLPRTVGPLDVPRNGTKARREYDKWMRRKAPTTT